MIKDSTYYQKTQKRFLQQDIRLHIQAQLITQGVQKIQTINLNSNTYYIQKFNTYME
jgi:hypothetical protein